MTKRSAVPTAKAIAFFHKFALKRRGRMSPHERRTWAKAMARAEAEASARGWRCEWEGDPDGDVESYGVVLRDDRGHALDQMWGVRYRDRDYRRLIEAELAAEALR